MRYLRLSKNTVVQLRERLLIMLRPHRRTGKKNSRVHTLPPFSLLRNHGADSDSGMGRFPGYLFRSKLRPDLRKYQKSSLPQMGNCPVPEYPADILTKLFRLGGVQFSGFANLTLQVAVPDELAECNLLRLGRCLVIITAPLPVYRKKLRRQHHEAHSDGGKQKS